MTIIERRTGARPEEPLPEPPSYSRDAAHRVAAVVGRTPGWRFHDEGLVDLVGGDTVALVLADGTVAGVVERPGRADGDGDTDADAAVHTALALFDALVETERVATEALAAAAQARDDAVHDHLTGLLNRRGWEQALDQEEARAARRPSAWVVAVVDIDHLKEANDRGGHLAGDVLLELAAGTIASSVRRNDVVARVGGDEFAVLGLDYAPHRPETLVGRIQRGLDDAGVSASVGAAVHDASVTLRETFHLADSAMYATKAARKGRLSST